jgi:hypothetical protein
MRVPAPCNPSHSSPLQALVDDLLGCHNRKVVVPALSPEGVKLPKPHSYDLDVVTDSFWREHRRLQFPAAIEGHDRELKAVLDKEAVIRRTAGPAADEAAELDASVADMLGAKGLVEAVDSLPALLRQKKLLEMHTNIMQVW